MKKNIKLLFTVVLAICVNLSTAQKIASIGIIGSTESSAFGVNSYNQKRQWSHRVGIDVLFKLNSKLSLEIGARYGYMTHFFKPYSIWCGNTTPEEIEYMKAELDKRIDHIIEVPLGIRYYFNSKNNRIRQYIEPFNSLVFTMYGTMYSNLGLKGGIEYKLLNHCSIFVQPTYRYMYFFKNEGLFKIPNTIAKRSTLGLETGLNFNF